MPLELLEFYIWGIQVRLFLDTEVTESERIELINSLLSLRSEVGLKSPIAIYINNIIDVAMSIFFVKGDKRPLLSDIRLRRYEYILLRQDLEMNGDKAFDIFTSVYPNSFPRHLLPSIQEYLKKEIKSFQFKIEESCFHGGIRVPLQPAHDSVFIPTPLECKYPRPCKDISRTQCLRISNLFEKVIVDFRKYEKDAGDIISPSSPLAYFYLPKCIQNKEILDQILPKLKELVKSQESVVDYNTFIQLWGIDNTIKSVSKSHTDKIIEGLSRLGYGIIPNYHVNDKRINSNEPCVIYKQDKGGFINIDQNFNLMELLTKLIAFVIQGETISDADFLSTRVIFSQLNDNAHNLAYLNGYLLWLLQTKTSLNKSTKEKVESLDNSNKKLFLRVLLNITSNNGNIKNNRVEALKKILPLLGKDENSVHSLLHQMLTDDILTLTVEKEHKSTKRQKRGKSNVKIDINKFTEYKQQTQESQSILSTIFNENDEEDEVVLNDSKNLIKEILSLLFTKELWHKAELEMICKEKGVMLGSILEEINDYSYSVVDDAVLEDEGDTINMIMDYKQDLL